MNAIKTWVFNAFRGITVPSCDENGNYQEKKYIFYMRIKLKYKITISITQSFHRFNDFTLEMHSNY